MWFEGIAWADAAASAAAAAQQPQSLIQQVLYSPAMPVALGIAVIYFMMIRPQTQKASQHDKMLNALKRNDEVVTAGGLIGKVAELSDKLVTLEIAPNVKVRVERGQITAISSYGKPPRKEKEKSE